MLHHIVMWNFKAEIEEVQKDAIKKAMKENLKGLVGKVPGLLTVEFVENPRQYSTTYYATNCSLWVVCYEHATRFPIIFSHKLFFNNIYIKSLRAILLQ